MASIRVTGNPTISEWVLAIRANRHLTEVTRADVITACHDRQVPIVEGRIDAKHAGNVYFAVNGRINGGYCVACQSYHHLPVAVAINDPCALRRAEDYVDA